MRYVYALRKTQQVLGAYISGMLVQGYAGSREQNKILIIQVMTLVTVKIILKDQFNTRRTAAMPFFFCESAHRENPIVTVFLFLRNCVRLILISKRQFIINSFF